MTVIDEVSPRGSAERGPGVGGFSDDADDASSLASSGVWAVIAAASVAIVGYTLSLADRGLDLTDESYYLSWIADPWSYLFSATQFGFVYHPVHLLVGGSVPLLRQFNVLITVLLAASVAWLILEEVGWPGDGSMSRPTRLATASAIGAASVGMLNQWLPTPSYNWLTLQGILVVVGAILLMGSERRTIMWSGSVLLGVGGVLLFLAKPTSALLLAMMVAAFFVLFDRTRFLPVALSAVVSLVALSIIALVIDGSLPAFADRVLAAAERAHVLDPRYGLRGAFRLDPLGLGPGLSMVFSVVFALAALASLALSAEGIAGRRIRYVVFLILPIGATAVAVGAYEVPWTVVWSQAFLYAAVPLGAVIVASVIGTFDLSSAQSRRAWGLVLLLALGPYVFSFGSNDNYWHEGSLAGVLWVMAAVLAIGTARGQSWRSRLLFAVLASQLVAALLLQLGMSDPYREPSAIPTMNAELSLRSNGSTIRVANSFGAYGNQLQSLADGGGFEPGTPLIDLTGITPGAAVVLGAHPPGLPWLLGGYPGSYPATERVLDLVACSEIGQSWILLEPEGRSHMEPTLLERYGRDIDTDYELVGALNTPDGMEQQLLRPRDDAPQAHGACVGD